ncbi:MAG: DUF1990 domain-containing protein [Trueperaceae bacterium]|nr:DUF1990 domain-containing protein [Trueperaceae bacterium]
MTNGFRFRLGTFSDEEVAAFRAEQAQLAADEVGIDTVDTDADDAVPFGYRETRYRTVLGVDPGVFEHAKDALQNRVMYPAPLSALRPEDVPLTSGATLVVVLNLFGCQALNAIRVLAIDDRPDDYRLVVGTLPGHALVGKEVFRIVREGERVVYELYALSKPHHWLAKLGWPLTRWVQRRFARKSLEKMARALLSPF